MGKVWFFWLTSHMSQSQHGQWWGIIELNFETIWSNTFVHTQSTVISWNLVLMYASTISSLFLLVFLEQSADTTDCSSGRQMCKVRSQQSRTRPLVFSCSLQRLCMYCAYCPAASLVYQYCLPIMTKEEMSDLWLGKAEVILYCARAEKSLGYWHFT